jgi:hypothetical protein
MKARSAGQREELGATSCSFGLPGERFMHAKSLYRAADSGWGYKYLSSASWRCCLRAWRGALCLLSAAALARLLQWSAYDVGGSRRLASQLLLLALVNPFSTHLFAMVMAQSEELQSSFVTTNNRTSRPYEANSGGRLRRGNPG